MAPHRVGKSSHLDMTKMISNGMSTGHPDVDNLLRLFPGDSRLCQNNYNVSQEIKWKVTKGDT